MATFQQWATQFLQGLGIQPSQGAINALAAVSHYEGLNDYNNPLNVIQPEPGSTNFNSVGVQRYPDASTGVKGAVTLFQGSHWNNVRTALATGNESQIISAFDAAYTWSPGTKIPAVSGNTLSSILSRNIGSGNDSSLGKPVATSSLTGNEKTIASFLKSKGLSDIDIAGILGNLQIESSFSPTAYNANEGAIGIAQWENGRRTALQAYAKTQGTSETDLNTQLNFLWSELTGPYSGSTYGPLQKATSASDAATIWDENFEGSSGSTRQQRINAANTVLSQIGGIIAGNAAGISNAISTGGTSATSASPAVYQAYNALSIAGINIPNPLPFITGLVPGYQDTKDALGGIAQGLSYISQFFSDLLWIFNPSNFIKAMLYVNGATLVIVGIIFVFLGARASEA